MRCQAVWVVVLSGLLGVGLILFWDQWWERVLWGLAGVGLLAGSNAWITWRWGHYEPSEP